MNWKLATNLGTLTLFVLAVAVAAQEVRYNYDTEADFTKYKTYMWVDVPGGEKVDSLTEKQIKSAIEEGLAARGLSKGEGGSADLAVAYHVAITGEKHLTLTGTGFGPAARWGGMGTVRGDTSTIPIGTLTVSMFDIHTKQLVWQGAASKQIDTKATPEKREKNLKKAAAKLFQSFPPRKKA